MASPLGKEPKPVSSSAKPVSGRQGRQTRTVRSVPFGETTRTVRPPETAPASLRVRASSASGSASAAPRTKSSSGALLMSTCRRPAANSARLRSS